jgi:hypothetical protein
MPLLNPGDPFPRMSITTTDELTLTLPGAFAGSDVWVSRPVELLACSRGHHRGRPV